MVKVIQLPSAMRLAGGSIFSDLCFAGAVEIMLDIA